MKKVIYDIGSNNGDDIPYYLLKADLVVAVEANPELCKLIQSKFESEIEENRLVIESCVISDTESCNDVPFYIHKYKHHLSQFPTPENDKCQNFNKVFLPSKSVSQIISKYGLPYYIKIDIEHFDAQILKALFKLNIYPPFISAESHSIEVFSLLFTQGKYNAFKLVEGPSVSTLYSEQLLSTNEGEITYSFPHHSAGPFGEDIHGEWIKGDHFLRLLSLKGLGWKDIHATSMPKSNPTRPFTNKRIVTDIIFYSIKKKVRKFKKRILKILNKALLSEKFSAKYNIRVFDKHKD